jgi:DNA-directed RNA polymerase II subunit RPB2
VEKTSKIVDPHKIHSSQWGYICPSETPEGHTVGIIKNMSLGCFVTIDSNPEIVHDCLKRLELVSTLNQFLLNITISTQKYLSMVFGQVSTRHLRDFYTALKNLKRSCILHIHTAIQWNVIDREIKIWTDGGRLVRPVFIVDENNSLRLVEKLSEYDPKTTTWQEYIIGKSKLLSR